MADFYGTLQGNRGQATRMGTKKTGIETYTASWKGAVRAHAYYNSAKKTDWVRVELTPWQGNGISKVLYEGPIGGRIRKISTHKHKTKMRRR